MNAISKLFARHILPMLRDLIDEYLAEEPGANAMEIEAFYGWLIEKTKDIEIT